MDYENLSVFQNYADQAKSLIPTDPVALESLKKSSSFISSQVILWNARFLFEQTEKNLSISKTNKSHPKNMHKYNIFLSLLN